MGSGYSYRIRSNAGLDPLGNHKTTDLKPVFNVGPSNGVSLAG